MNLPPSHPILSCAAAGAFEKRFFGGDAGHEWAAMQQAGRAIATAVRHDFAEIGGFRGDGRILVLAGKGHNGGDALIAARTLLQAFPGARAEVRFVFGERALRPLAAQAWQQLAHTGRAGATTGAGAGGYELCLDGVFGFQFRPPADERVRALLEQVNALRVRLRAAVDLPSAGFFRADFTYATGIVKTPLLDAPEAGRVRYLDLGFFADDVAEAGPASTSPATDRVLIPEVLAPLAALRPARCDKRTYGHVLVLGGSRSFPGAILMTVLAALRSGAGLVTAFVPESLVPAYAARAPEAMWVGWPETPRGGLALEGEHLLRARLERAAALVMGPGMAREPETLALVRSIAASSPVPFVLDADALQADIVTAGDAPRIVTPHAGEFARIEEALRGDKRAIVVLKGPVTRVQRGGDSVRYHSFFGGPVLARGGSGDLLAGLVGGLLAQTPQEPLLAAARGVVWHGCAADALARTHGQTAVQVTQLLDFLGPSLQESGDEQ